MASSSLTKIISYATEGNFTFPTATVGFTNLSAELVLGSGGTLTFSETFDTSTGFTFSTSAFEFTGGLVRQKIQQLTNATFHVQFGTNLDGSYGDGTLTGLSNGTPSISVAGGLADLSSIASRYISWGATGNAANTQVGTIRARFQVNYSGTPSENQIFASLTDTGTSSTVNELSILHRSTGQLGLFIKSSADGIIMNTDQALFAPTVSTTYELELNWKFTSSGAATQLFLDGVQQGATVASTGTRTAVHLLKSGKINTLIADDADFFLDELTVFSTVQHTAGYTPSAHSPLYQSGTVELPSFTHLTTGAINNYDTITTTEVRAPRYTIKPNSGSFLYHDGSGWTASSGQYAQANSLTDINANLGSLTAALNSSISTIRIHFTDDSILSSVADLNMNYQKTGAYSALSPAVIENSGVLMDSLESFTETSSTIPGSDQITHILNVSGQDKYWDGAAWSNSDATLAQSNAATAVETNKAALDLSSGATIKVKSLLTSADGTTTPRLTTVTIGYNFFNSQSDPATCTVWGFYRDVTGTGVASATVTIKLKRDTTGQYREAGSAIIEKEATTTTDSNGRFEIDIIRSSEYEGNGVYQLSIIKTADSLNTSRLTKSTKVIDFTVPDAADVNITAQITAASVS